jgi:prephenate dehydrogenase
MSYAIIGFGKIGQALAHAFARKNIDVTVASRRPPEALAPQARAIGPTVVAKSLRDALEADTIILAVPFGNIVRLRRPCRAGKARQSSTRRTRSEFPLKSWTVCCPPPSSRSPSPALRS